MKTKEEVVFLCQVTQILPDNKYKVLVDKEDKLSLPGKDSTEKIIKYSQKIDIGRIIMCRGVLDEETRDMQVSNIHYLEVNKDSNLIEVPDDIINMIDSLEYFPKDIIKTIFEEDLEDDETELSDSQDGEGAS